MSDFDLPGMWERADFEGGATDFDPDYLKGTCEICGEPFDQGDPRPSMSEVGEFVDPEDGCHYITHAQCGIDAGYNLA